MPTIYIDDKAYEVPAGDNILKACLSLGLNLPYFCWHPAMGSVGACRQCALVQYRDAEDTRGRIVMGCMTPVVDGARFSMQGGAAAEFRENIIESLMLNHPHDCPVCAEGGECHLQDMTVMVGHRNRRYRGKKNTHRNQYLGPLVHHEMNRCISCYRCTRFYNDYAGGTDLSAQGAHDHVYFGRQEDGVLESEFAGNLVEVCPTGVFTDKPLVKEYTRKWDLQSAPSVCTGCALGCNTMPGERYGKLKRTHNRFNREVNGYFLCDRGRFGGSFVNGENRALYAGLRNADGSYDAIVSGRAMQDFADWCGGEQGGKKVVGIGSPRASLESNYLLRRIVGEQNFCSGMADHEDQLVTEIARLLAGGKVVTPSLHQIESADAILILGEDVTNTAPRLALSLRQSVRNLALEMAANLKIPVWQDEAVRVLAQDQLSPLYIATAAATRLDDVAVASIALSPADIARLGFAIAAQLDTSLPAVPDLDDALVQFASQVADSLRNAARPLIVSGSGCQSLAVVQAAASIAHAVQNPAAMLSYCVPESNSLGSALLASGDEASLYDLCQRAESGDIDTLIVMENDLYRRAPRAQIDTLIKNVGTLIVLDAIETPTLAKSALALPAATSAESEGTLVSSEGRAQRYYPVFLPAGQRLASWQWLNHLGQALHRPGFETFQHFDDVTTACALENSRLSQIVAASPTAGFRSHGLKIPRQPLRYSGRTAMHSDTALHEPKQPQDEDSPLSYSMEGAGGVQPGALLSFVWAPGWNSNQSLQKFQSEAGGALAGGTAGVRLLEPAAEPVKQDPYRVPKTLQRQENSWLLLPLYQIFGSEELSAHAPAIRELISRPFIQISPQDAAQLNVTEGDGILLSLADAETSLQVVLNSTLPAGCAGYGVGLPGAAWLPPETLVTLRKDPHWLATERGDADV